MAIITKRRKAYSVIYQIKDENGNSKQVHETYYDYRLAVKRKSQIEDSINEIQINKESEVIDFMYQYISIVSLKECSFNSCESQASIVNNYLSYVFKDMRICDLEKGYGQKILDRLKQIPAVGSRNRQAHEKMPASMLYKAHSLLNKSFNYLLQHQFIEENEFLSIPNEKKKNTKNSAEWKIEYFEKILNYCDEINLFLFLHLLFSTGFNISEILALSWDDLKKKNDAYIISSSKELKRRNLNEIESLNKKDIIHIYQSQGFNNTNTSLILTYKATKTALKFIKK